MQYQNLQLGDTGDDVKILQEKLKILGFYNAIVSGSFGLSTEEGVKAFQREYMQDVTGTVDQAMWELLLQFTEPAYTTIGVFPTLQKGDTGSSVQDLQTKLETLLYYTGKVNSIFDLETENAVKRFQFNNELTATGIVNQETWNVLNSLYGNLAPCIVEDTEDVLLYTVQKGDTLYAIARRFDTTVDEIKELNGLVSNTLTVGQTLKIPSKQEEETLTYIVQSGDTLYSIAKRYGTTVDEIKRLNRLTSNTLTIGQVLQIPQETEVLEEFTYTVQKGDTLYAIARRFDTTVDEIKKLNRLTSNTLMIGQVLKIPWQNVSETFSYTVQKGDTLYSIAKRYDTTVEEIKKINSLTSDTLTIGQILQIPQQ